MKFLAIALLALVTQLQAHASADAAFPIFYEFKLTTDVPGVGITDIMNNVEATSSNLFPSTSDETGAKVRVHVANEVIGSENVFTVWIYKLNESGEQEVIGKKFAKRFAPTDPTQLGTLTKIIIGIATLERDTNDTDQSTDPEPTGKQNPWSSTIGFNGKFNAEGKVTMGGTVEAYGSATASYDHWKISTGGGFYYSYIKNTSLKGSTYGGDASVTTVYHFKKTGHWSVGVVVYGGTSPDDKNYDVSTTIDLGTEWIMYPIYEDKQTRNFVVRAGMTAGYNKYALETELHKFDEAFGEAFIKMYFVQYAAKGKFKAQIGAGAKMNVAQPKYSSVQLSGTLTYLIGKRVTLRGDFSVTYRPNSLNMLKSDFLDGESPLFNTKAAILFVDYNGFKPKASFGLDIAIGKSSAVKRNNYNLIYTQGQPGR